VPLCRAHHRELHQSGIQTFEAKHPRVSLSYGAVITALRWMHTEAHAAIPRTEDEWKWLK
jgi:hypothetical protein